jgi:hypothetical protein
MADPAQLILHVDAGAGAEVEDQTRLAQRLRQDLRELDVDGVDWVRAGEAPAGSKGDAAALGSLAVTLAPSVITPLMGMLSSWLSRHDRATVTVESGGQKLTLTGSPSAEQRELVEAFIKGKASTGS